MSRFFMVRHAQASFGGPEYDVLSAIGEEQARCLGAFWAEQRLTFDQVFAGPRQRHQRTAEIVGKTLRAQGLSWPEVIPLTELDEYAGLEVFRFALPALAAREPAVKEMLMRKGDPPKAPPEMLKLFQTVMAQWVRGEMEVPGVETWAQFRVRARRGLDILLEAGAGGRQVAVFTSTGPVAVAMDLAFGLDDERLMETSWQLRNTSVSEFLFAAPRFSLSVFNALPHLSAGELITHI